MRFSWVTGIRPRIYGGVLLPSVLGVVVAAFGVWNLLTVGHQIETLSVAADEAQRALEVSRSAETMRLLATQFRRLPDETVAKAFKDSAEKVRILLDATTAPPGSAGQAVFNRISQTLETLETSFDQLIEAASERQRNELKLKIDNEALTVVSTQLVEIMTTDRNSMGTSANVSLLMSGVSTVREACWRYVAIHDPQSIPIVRYRGSMAIEALIQSLPASEKPEVDVTLNAVKTLVRDFDSLLLSMAAMDEAYDKLIEPQVALLDQDTHQAAILFGADRSNAARETAHILSTTETTQESLVIAAILGSIVLASVIGSSIVRPLGGMTKIMERLAAGDHEIEIADTDRRDEIGDMAKAVQIFKEGLIKADHLARRVAERTEELAKSHENLLQSNAKLQEEVDMRVRSERALRESRTRLKSITDSLFEGVVVVDPLGQVVFANPSARQLLELDHFVGDIEGLPLESLFVLRRTEADNFTGERAFWRHALDDLTTHHDNDAIFDLTTGHSLSVAFACSITLDDDRKGQYAIISFRDIGLLKQAEREAMQSARLASIGELAAGIAHEINTPIQYIGDNLRYVGEALPKIATCVAAGRTLADHAAETEELADATARYQETVSGAKISRLLTELPDAVAESLDGISQIARIVLSMKEFSHPGTSVKVTTDINQALESTLTVTRNAWKHVAEVERDFDPALPLIVCHAGEINQVFLNLIVNAAQAIETSGKPLPGKIRISTTSGSGWLEIRIADNGLGIPKAIRERIFDLFFTTKPVGKGTGQGLAICRDVVMVKHGGTIDVDGIEGEGAVFTVRLPFESERESRTEDET
jgi:signal transduction histidine kinase/HAMP domain-containing protein